MTVSSRNIALYGGGLALTGLVVWAFAMTGSPATQRKLAEDREIAGKLECVACYAMHYACESKKRAYPETRRELAEFIQKEDYCHSEHLGCYNYSDYYSRQKEPRDFSAIRYTLSDQKEVTLCATFHFDEAEQKRLRENKGVPVELRDYKRGEQCFTFKPRKCPNR